MEKWSNNAAIGYMILAAEKLGYSEKQIQALCNAMKGRFDVVSVEEANKTYCLSPY